MVSLVDMLPETQASQNSAQQLPSLLVAVLEIFGDWQLP